MVASEDATTIAEGSSSSFPTPFSYSGCQGSFLEYVPWIDLAVVKERCTTAYTSTACTDRLQTCNEEDIRDDQRDDTEKDAGDDKRTPFSCGIGFAEQEALQPIWKYFQWKQEPTPNLSNTVEDKKEDRISNDRKVDKSTIEKAEEGAATEPQKDQARSPIARLKKKTAGMDRVGSNLKQDEVIAEALAACAAVNEDSEEPNGTAITKDATDHLKEKLAFYLDEQVRSGKDKKRSRKQKKAHLKKHLKKSLKEYLKENPKGDNKKKRKTLKSTMEQQMEQMVKDAVDESQKIETIKKKNLKKGKMENEKKKMVQSHPRKSEAVSHETSTNSKTSPPTKPLESSKLLLQGFVATEKARLRELEQSISQDQLQEVSSVVSESIRQLQGDMPVTSDSGEDEKQEDVEQNNAPPIFERLYKVRQQAREYEAQNEVKQHAESGNSTEVEFPAVESATEDATPIKAKSETTNSNFSARGKPTDKPSAPSSWAPRPMLGKTPGISTTRATSQEKLLSHQLSDDPLLTMTKEELDAAIAEEMAHLKDLQSQFLKKVAMATVEPGEADEQSTVGKESDMKEKKANKKTLEAKIPLEEELTRLRDMQASIFKHGRTLTRRDRNRSELKK